MGIKNRRISAYGYHLSYDKLENGNNAIPSSGWVVGLIEYSK